MDNALAIQRGAQGERKVAEILEELRPKLGFGLLHDVLLEFNGHTTQMDHLLVDQFGLLVIETKNYGALLKGTSDDHNWTVCYKDGNTRQMYNPLKQNDGHRKWLHKVLVQNQRDLPENYIQSMIVFARGETGALELSDIDQMRVVTPDGLSEHISTRYDFQPNDGQLGSEAQADLWQFLHAADKSGDPQAVARHIAECQNAKRARQSGRKGAPWRRSGGSRPKARPNPARAGRTGHGTARSSSNDLRGRLVEIGLGLLLLWFMVYGGGIGLMARVIGAAATSGFAAAQQQTAGAQPPASVRYDVNLALSRLRESSPETYSHLSDPGSPMLSTTNGLPTYTWHYVTRTGGSAASVHTIAITLDTAGRIVGVTGSK